MQEIKDKYLKAKRALFDKVYGERLNPEQARAVFTTRGPLLVLAGAGSGKTTVLVNRIAFLIKYGNAYFSETVPEGLIPEAASALEAALTLDSSEIEEILPEFISEPCPPWALLAITFTNKAAREIKDRLAKSFDDPEISSSIWSGTFHSVCLRILRKFGERLGYRDGFSIYDTDDKKRMISLCMKELEIDEKRLNPKVVANAISKAKDELVSPEEYKLDSDPRSKDILSVYKLYQKKLAEYNAVDFDDIIMKTVELLESDDEVRGYYQSKFKYVLVDEYQDTNYAQFVLTKLLSDKYRNIMVVGDDDQSIYRFRGATVENILSFDKTYPDATVVKLEQNYRSTKNILDAANSVISRNSDRHSKRLWCDKGEGQKIILHGADDQNEEGKYIIREITSEIRNSGRRHSDFAVLYRVNALGRALQTAFVKSGMPYKVVGDLGFYERKEVKDMIAYLTVLVSPTDNLRLKRIINEPKRKIGAATVDAIEEIAEAEGVSMYEIMRRAGDYTALKKNAEKLAAFVELLEGIKSRYELPSQLVSALFEETGYKSMLVSEGFEGEGKIQNVEEFIGAAIEYERQAASREETPETFGFLEEVALITDVDKYDENSDAVILMTVHAAKGLEFPVVFLAGMEDGIFPSQQNIGEPTEMSEERRLAYVAITRAKEKLYVTHAKERMMYGRTNYAPLSVFVRQEIPRELIYEETKRPVPPRYTNTGYYSEKPKTYPQGASFGELNRRPEISSAPRRRTGAAEYGIERIAPGERVSHQSFGEGVIVGARDMGGDILYEVDFDNFGKKKLMATYAKLKKI